MTDRERAELALLDQMDVVERRLRSQAKDRDRRLKTELRKLTERARDLEATL